MGLSITNRVDDIFEDTTLELEVKFKDSVDAAVDPTVVELKVTQPDDTVITKTKALSELTNPAVGTWQYRFKFDQVGAYDYTWFGESTGSSSSELVRAVVQVTAKS